MKIEFNSVQEVLEFADSQRALTSPTSGSLTPGNIDPEEFITALGKIAANANKVAAMRIYRAVFNAPLLSAKVAIESSPFFNRTIPQPHVGCGDPDCCPEQ